MRLKRLKAVVALILVVTMSLTSCTSFQSYQDGQDLADLGKWDEAVVAYTKALEVDPNNMKYQIELGRAKLEASREHFKKGQNFRAAADKEKVAGNGSQWKQLNELAAIEFELTIRLDPTNQYAAVEYTKAVESIQEANWLEQGVSIEEMKKQAISKAQPPQLNPASSEPISLSFPRPTNVKDIYRALGNSFGINIVFDQAVKDDEKISIELRDVTAHQALERVMQAANHFYKVLDEKTIIVVPDTVQTRRDYEDLVIRTFYLSNGDAEQVTNVIRTMLEARNVFPLKALNAITIRDTADKVLIAEKIIEANDKAKAEVVVKVELLQVDSTKLRDLGMTLGTGSPGQGVLLGEDGKPVGSLPINEFADIALGEYSFTVPTIAYSLIKTSTDAQLLAQPSLRISEGEDATLHIGRKQPIPVSTLYTGIGTGGVNQGPIVSYQYQDIGIKIGITPRVHHNREISLKLTVEISNLAGSVPAIPPNPAQPIIGTRTIQSTIRLKDGETNFLAGLYRQDESLDVATTPFLGDLPIIGRLFRQETNNGVSTDVVLTMTPHIIRIANITEDDLAPMWVGTLNNITFRGLSPRVESAIGVDPFSAGQQRGDFPITPDAQGNIATPTTPGPQPGTAAPISPGAGPSDPFRQPPTQTPPATPTPVPTPDPRVGGTPPTPQGSLSTPGEEKPVQVASFPASALSNDSYQLKFSPRIAPQPSKISFKPGEEKLWSVVGMDLSGLSVPQLVLRYDPMALDVAGAGIGTAFLIDSKAPPMVKVDAASGTIRVLSTDGNPLRFQNGGEVLTLRVRGGVTGDTMLVIEPPSFSSIAGERVDVAVAGGAARVE